MHLLHVVFYIVTSLLFSYLEEDPLYIAYADMMAKVVAIKFISCINTSGKTCVNNMKNEL